MYMYLKVSFMKVIFDHPITGDKTTILSDSLLENITLLWEMQFLVKYNFYTNNGSISPVCCLLILQVHVHADIRHQMKIMYKIHPNTRNIIPLTLTGSTEEVWLQKLPHHITPPEIWSQNSPHLNSHLSHLQMYVHKIHQTSALICHPN